MKGKIIKNNNYKKEFLAELEVVIHAIEKNRVNPHIDRKQLAQIYKRLVDLYEDLDAALGTGKEDNIEMFKDAAEQSLKMLRTSLTQELASYAEEALIHLEFAIGCWIDILDGGNVITPGDLKTPSKTRTKLLRRLEELKDIIGEFSSSITRLDIELKTLNTAANELDEKIIDEGDEDRLDELYRKVTVTRKKIESLQARKENYDACYNLLDLIKTNANEIVHASQYNDVDLLKAKSYLDINKLRDVLNQPEKALNILKNMNKELERMTAKTLVIDKGISGVLEDSSTSNYEAKNYKEELIAKRNAQNQISEEDELPFGNPEEDKVRKDEDWDS